MQTHPHSAPESEVALAVAPCPALAIVKARAKALKKWRKQERLRFFSGWCAGLHAIGFSF